MTPIEKMKHLLEKHSTGWRFMDQTEDGSASSEVQFLNALMQLAPHFVDLWENAESIEIAHREGLSEGMAVGWTVEALSKLNKEAAGILN